MFYQAVEEYVVQNRRRELAKELALRRQLHHSALHLLGCNALTY